MLVSRLLVTIILLPLGLLTIHYGGLPYYLLVALLLGLAAWEYANLFRFGGSRPSVVLITGGTLLLVLGRVLDGFASAPWLASLLILLSMTYHLVAYERGRDQAGSDFAISLSGILYLGWIGAYLISLRQLPGGEFWLLVILPAVWLADMGAYFAGSRFGKHKLSPRLSPKKTWEGYLAGIPAAIIGTALLAALFQAWTGPDSAITPLRGALVGLVMGVLTTLGDLGESMIKRQAGMKDSGSLLPGHGGVFDRIDSWLWAAPIGFYFIVWVVGV
jgi:phosphatidate cytidylyltransferase